MRAEEGKMTVTYRTHDDRLLAIVWKQTDVIDQGPAPPIDPDLERTGEDAMRASGFFGDPLGEAYVKAEKPLFVRCGCCGGSGRLRGLFLAKQCPECKGEGGKTFT
jgi:hypothetical protein